MDIRTINYVLRRLQGEFCIPIDYEKILEGQYCRFLRKNDVVIDIGAHAGRHTKTFSALCSEGRVEAFEPLPHMAEALRALHLPSVRVHEYALSDHEGTESFVWARGTPEESGLRQRIFNIPSMANPTRIAVGVTSLDRYFPGLDRCDYIKLDTEGAEIDCLRGGRKLIARLRPVISIEYGQPSYSAYGHTKFTLYDLTQELGYDLLDIFGTPIASREEWEGACDVSYWDFFLCPKERTEALRQAIS